MTNLKYQLIILNYINTYSLDNFNFSEEINKDNPVLKYKLDVNECVFKLNISNK